MNKTKFFSSLLVAGLFTVTSVFVSCKDYDDDIEGLKKSIASNATAIESLQSLKDQGIVITGVQQSGKDVILTLSDGTTKTIKGGEDATPADVWTIGEDGFWYKNSVKTDYRAVGINGTNGTNGADGINGADGQNGFNGTDGMYYVPNQTTGCFDIYNGDGTFKESTNIRWRVETANGAPKVIAVQTAKSVILSGVEGYGEVVIPTAADLESLVFLPKTYYWGIEATTVRTLTMKWYNITLPLTTYIDDAAKRTEVIGTKRPLSPELPIVYLPYDGTTWVAPDGIAHERYDYGTGTITVTLKANAEYHINPSIAWFDNNTSVSVLSDNTTFTRAGLGNAIVSFRGNNTGENHDWKVDGGILNVPLNVNGKVSTVTTDGKYTFAAKPGVTMFATQVTYKNDKDETCVVTSDYAAIVEETVKNLKIAHVPYNLKTAPYQLSETGMLNHHCGRCDLPLYMGSPYYFGDLYRGVHLFQSIDECKAYILATPRKDDNTHLGEGWDLVNYQEDIDLNALVETHYTNVNGAHDVFDDDDFNRNFEYAFELTSVKLGDNKTDESAHAALYYNEETKHWYLHPQDPETGGLNGRPYDAAKATDVVVNRVPVVRVKLIYKADNKVIDYAYLPIRITKEVKDDPRPTVIVNYSTDKAHQIIRYNDCWNAGGQTQDLIVTNWRQTEEDLYSAQGLSQIFDRQTFDNTYRVEVKPGGAAATFGSAIDAQQYLVTKNADGTYSFKKVDTPHTLTITDDQFGTINYTENTVGGHTSSIFTWNADGDEIRDFAVAGVTQVVRAVRLYAVDGNVSKNPDIFVIFTSGALSLTKYTIKGDPNLKANIIAKYWYESGKFNQGTDELHVNTITPEENDGDKTDLTENGWKPKDFDDRFADVFYGNFRTMSGKSTRPVTWITYNVYDKDNKIVNQTVPNPPFVADNYEADFFFADENNGKEFKGFLDNGEAKTFVLKNHQLAIGGDKTKKNLYARLKTDPDQDIYYQKIASIDEWDARTIGQLREMKIALNWGNPRIADDPASYAKALLNYKTHSKIGDSDVLDIKVAIYAVTKVYKANGADLVDPVSYTGIDCPLVLENNTFSVRFLRPIDIDETNNPEIEDAHAKEGVGKQKVYLKDLVVLYKDWRDVRFKLTPDYEQYYAPVDESKLNAEVAGVVLNQNLSANPNVKTDLNGKIEPLNQVSSDLQLVLREDAAGKYIEYTNNSSNVQSFNIYIPVKVQYYWGTMYDDITLHVKRTLANAPRK